jgi:hypothetical protein
MITACVAALAKYVPIRETWCQRRAVQAAVAHADVLALRVRPGVQWQARVASDLSVSTSVALMEWSSRLRS